MVKTFSIFFKTIIILFCLFGLFVAFLPVIMSSDWGRNQTLDWINRSIAGKLEIRSWNLHWGKGQLLEGISLKDAQNHEILKIEKFSTEAALWQLLAKKPNWGLTEADSLDARLAIDKNGRTNFQKIFRLHATQESESDPPSIIVLSNVNLKSEIFVPGRPLSMQITGSTRQGNLQGSFDTRILLHGLWASSWEGLKHEAQKYFSIEGSKEAQIQAHIINFPTDLIDYLAALKNPHLKGELRSLLGDRLNLEVRKKPSASGLAFELMAATPTIEGKLNGHLSNGILTLDKAFKCTIQMTPLFNQTFLAPNVPLLNTVVGAENPVSLTIEPAGFFCPLLPFSLEKVIIEKATLDLGKLRFKNEGEISSILRLIRPLTDEYLTIWFTPLYLEQKQGILSLKRFDMLIDHAYTLANWGRINLLTHQAEFDLGLPAQTLNDAFGIKGLDEQYILQIPFTSASGKVKIDQTKFVARVSSLLAQTRGGIKGKLFGSVLDAATAREEEPYPAPTTQPFPWTGEFTPKTKKAEVDSLNNTDSLNNDDSKSNQETKKEKKKRKRKKHKHLNLDEENLKELEKGASHLLDQWLRGHGDK